MAVEWGGESDCTEHMYLPPIQRQSYATRTSCFVLLERTFRVIPVGDLKGAMVSLLPIKEAQ